jgi:hypothetical protein
VKTLSFVSPARVLSRVVDQLRVDLDPNVVNALSETDFGVWSTPEGVPYVDGVFGFIFNGLN